MCVCPVDLSINNNGRDVKQLCIDNSLLILNNLVFDNKFYEGGMTFRRKKKWISELDLCILSPALLGYTERLHVSNDTKNPSDHAPVSVEFKFTSDLVSQHSILARAETTDGHAVLMSDAYNQPLCRKPIPLHHIDQLQFAQQLQDLQPPGVGDESVESLCTKFSDVMYQCATNAKSTPPAESSNSSPDMSRWQRIIDCDDPKMLWRAIDWKGQFDPTPEKEKPSDEELRVHLEQLLNPADLDDLWPSPENAVSIPLLDDPLKEEECSRVILKHLKPNKLAGPDGNSPGIFHLLPAQWLSFLTLLLSLVFTSASYPVAWTKAK